MPLHSATTSKGYAPIHLDEAYMMTATATATVIFENSSSYDIILTRRGEQAGTTIKQAARLSISVSFGDIFDVTFPGQPKLSYRPIVINDLAIGKINIYSGKAPLREV